MTGLFFGSFNPVHIGHLIVAEYLACRANLDQVWLVVSPQNPFKRKARLADVRHRYRMLTLAVRGNRRLRASDVELTLSTPSYTIRTLAELQRRHPRRSFALLMGADTLLTLPRWRHGDHILRHYPILVYRREVHLPDWVHDFRNIRFYDAPLLQISATAIRSMVRQQLSVRYLVPESVRRYILQHGLYSGG